jgi:hypothetical protein
MKNRFKELTAFILASFLLFCLVTPCLAEEEEPEDEGMWDKVTTKVSDTVSSVQNYVFGNNEEDLEEEPEEEESTSTQPVQITKNTKLRLQKNFVVMLLVELTI